MLKLRRSKRGESRQLLLLLNHYVVMNGRNEIDMHEVATWLLENNYPPPKPRSSADILAERLTKAARSEVEYDPDDGVLYRKYHSVADENQPSMFKWFDIRHASRAKMHKSFSHRRKQIVNDAFQLTLDLRSWNKLHPDEQPLEKLDMNLTEDIEERLIMYDNVD